MYDLIGDIHGHADELVQLLKALGYEKAQGSYRHPDRQVIFMPELEIFVSWSRPGSRQAAEAFKEWLPTSLPGVKPWVSLPAQVVQRHPAWAAPETHAGQQVGQVQVS